MSLFREAKTDKDNFLITMNFILDNYRYFEKQNKHTIIIMTILKTKF